MAPVGAELTFRAWVVEVKKALVRCRFDVKHGDCLIAEGTQDQICLPAQLIKDKIAEAYQRLDNSV